MVRRRRVVTSMSKKPGATSALPGMQGILLFTTPTFSKGCPAATKRSTTSCTMSGLLDSDSIAPSPTPRCATACAMTFMPSVSMSRATKV